jgi:hypothetical protein
MIKGNTSWVGVSRVHYAAYFIERAWNMDDYAEMIERYQCIVETVIEFRRYLPTIQKKLVGKKIRLPESEDIWKLTYIAKGYKLE